MKFVKKLTSLFLAVVMVMAMGITAFAAETTPAATTYKISVAEGDTHTYTVYQVFTGDLSTDGKTLSNVKAGTAYDTTKGDAAAAAETLAGLSTTGQALANTIAEYVDTTKSSAGTVSANSPLENLAPGYYFLVDTTSPVAQYDSKNTSVAVVLNKDTTVTKKRDTIEFEKKIDDINDTTGAENKLQDSADYDIGDKVPYTLKATLPDNYTDYTVYYLQFQDQMEKGLTFNNDVKVYIDDVEVSSDKYTVASGSYSSTGSITADGASAFTVTFNDLKSTKATNNSVVTVKFTATLNQNAVIGSTGNVNEARLEYSNNPNNKQGGEKGTTPWDTVIAFTYKVVINKVDSSNQPLTGAKFTLYKKVLKNADATTDAEKYEKKEIQVVEAESGSTFTFNGLDDGEYILSETKTPSGYNSIDDITFKVEADHSITWTTQTRTEILTSLTGTKVTGEITLANDKSAGSLTADVVNKKGAELPSTGGMGTTVIYIAGIAMIVAAGVVVIARKRMA